MKLLTVSVEVHVVIWHLQYQKPLYEVQCFGVVGWMIGDPVSASVTSRRIAQLIEIDHSSGVH